MKKYEVTASNPYFKEGAILESDASCTINGLEILTSYLDVRDWSQKGWIKEIQEKEFTERDMAACFAAGAIRNDNYRTGKDYTSFKEWIKEHKK